ncbi:MAG TPA: substrate-binding domain-containing protein [Tepidisphaeraceae bacterium]|nr:substrate-binding domain-containing protein [Tepidisphaeraceae bacterium]
MFRSALISVCCIALFLAAGCGKGEDSGKSTGAAGGKAASSAGDQKLRIAVIPKGTTHVFWKSVEAGARKASAELGVEIVWKGPLKEDDRADQIKLVEQFVSEGVSGIVLAPLDFEALARPVQSAMERKIPVVVFDSALKGEAGKDFVSFVATNNRKGGEMAGEQLAKLINGKGNAVLLRYSVGSASTGHREDGFMEAMKKYPDIKMLVDNRYGGATVGEAKKESMNLIDQLKQAQGIFCSNESVTLGMLGALRDNDLAGKVAFVGFDATPPLVEALRKGEVKALIAQDPTRMGYEAVKTLVSHLRGQQVPTMVDTGVRLLTQESLNEPETKKFLGLE